MAIVSRRPVLIDMEEGRRKKEEGRRKNGNGSRKKIDVKMQLQ
ncbi:hypothetical protein QT971_20340 [Microcoleus sp. herbarium19]